MFKNLSVEHGLGGQHVAVITDHIYMILFNCFPDLGQLLFLLKFELRFLASNRACLLTNMQSLLSGFISPC